ncbi:hypothetical protein EYC80_002783 [Monilinia laxa]|uniref:Uncharacterized protein n=1 Tax=Monilinia laxa TaxID=61186 RepID=A0A5N6KBW3_MONLA|nr:hypothetical protein EYC80_002783 [Monilinia laxa]
MLKSLYYQKNGDIKQVQHCAPESMQGGRRKLLQQKNKRPLDNNLIFNGILVWAHDPTPDEYNLPPKPFVCCRTSGGHRCEKSFMNQRGYNHSFLVIDHYQTPGSDVAGDLTLKIIPTTSFGGETILQTHSKTSHEKRLKSLPFEFKGTSKKNRAEELQLLEKLNIPLLGLEYGEISRQIYLDVNHIYEVSVKQLHCFGQRVSNPAKYVRLNKESYNNVRSIFGLEDDEGSFDRRVEKPSTPSGTPKSDRISTAKTLGTGSHPLACDPTPRKPRHKASRSFPSESSSIYRLPSTYLSESQMKFSEYASSYWSNLSTPLYMSGIYSPYGVEITAEPQPFEFIAAYESEASMYMKPYNSCAIYTV